MSLFYNNSLHVFSLIKKYFGMCCTNPSTSMANNLCIPYTPHIQHVITYSPTYTSILRLNFCVMYLTTS